jgi:hypothetical protein
MFVYKNLDADPLRYVLDLAYRQAMAPDGKGMTRHGSDKPFREQISSVITRLVGIGYPLGQALKKRDEASRLEMGKFFTGFGTLRQLSGGLAE